MTENEKKMLLEELKCTPDEIKFMDNYCGDVDGLIEYAVGEGEVNIDNILDGIFAEIVNILKCYIEDNMGEIKDNYVKYAAENFMFQEIKDDGTVVLSHGNYSDICLFYKELKELREGIVDRDFWCMYTNLNFKPHISLDNLEYYKALIPEALNEVTITTGLEFEDL